MKDFKKLFDSIMHFCLLGFIIKSVPGFAVFSTKKIKQQNLNTSL